MNLLDSRLLKITLVPINMIHATQILLMHTFYYKSWYFILSSTYKYKINTYIYTLLCSSVISCCFVIDILLPSQNLTQILHHRPHRFGPQPTFPPVHRQQSPSISHTQHFPTTPLTFHYLYSRSSLALNYVRL